MGNNGVVASNTACLALRSVVINACMPILHQGMLMCTCLNAYDKLLDIHAQTPAHKPVVVAAASLPLALASLVEAKGSQLEGSRILMYSYGSGLAAGMFTLKARQVSGPFALNRLQSTVCFCVCLQLLCCIVWV